MADIDIGVELHDKIKAAFERRCSADPYVVAIKKKVEKGTATMEDTSAYARRLGENLRKAIESTTKPEDLPGEKMYYNIAQSILDPLLHDTYEDVNGICADVQQTLDAKKGIGLKPQKADFPDERVQAAIGGASVKDTAEHAIQVLGRTAENITGSFQADYVKKNVEFRSKAGLNCYIERKDGHNCCKWCAGLAGKYKYPDEVPKDVYRRHDNCTCDVTYVSEKGRQNVHTKQYWSREKNREYLRQLDAEKKAKRAEYKANGKKLQKVRFKPSESAARRERIEKAESLPKPMKLTRAEAKEFEKVYFQNHPSFAMKSVITDMFEEWNNGQKDTIKFRNIEKELEKSDIGKEIKDYLKNNPCKINIMYNVDVDKELKGLYNPIDDEIYLYASNTKTVSETAATLIHEVTHRRYDIGGNFWSECVCKAQELKHKERKNVLTISEKRGIIKSVKETYSEIYPDMKWRRIT